MVDVPVVERHTSELLATIYTRDIRLGSHTQLQNATKNPNQEKKNTRPYILMGLNPGIERAFRLTGLTTGALHNVVGSNIVVDPPNCLES